MHKDKAIQPLVLKYEQSDRPQKVELCEDCFGFWKGIVLCLLIITRFFHQPVKENNFSNGLV